MLQTARVARRKKIVGSKLAQRIVRTNQEKRIVELSHRHQTTGLQRALYVRLHRTAEIHLGSSSKVRPHVVRIDVAAHRKGHHFPVVSGCVCVARCS
jgi:hypothetical protein